MNKTKKESKKGIFNNFKSMVEKNKSVLIPLGFVFSLLILFLVFFNNHPVEKPLDNKPRACVGCNNEECPAKRNQTCNCQKAKTGGCPYRTGK
jgi:hypothetical protein